METADTKAPSKGGRRLNSSTEKIRQVAAGLGTYSLRQLREVGFTENQVKIGNETLLRQGRAQRIGHGVYQFIPERKSPRETPTEDRIWHAMRINPTWSCSDIAVQAGSTTSYIYKRLREYRAEGYVRRAGQRSTPTGHERLWRLTGKAQELLIRPNVELFESDPLVAAVTNLNKLVCTGKCRFEDARAKAVELCRQILDGLSQKPLTGRAGGAGTDGKGQAV
jgi:hypothetical protein